MINDLEELKYFVEWCRSTGVKSMAIGDVKFELSDYALIQNIQGLDPQSAPLTDNESTSTSTKTLVDTSDEDEKDLYWSSN